MRAIDKKTCTDGNTLEIIASICTNVTTPMLLRQISPVVISEDGHEKFFGEP